MMLVAMDSALAIGFRASASCPRLSPPPSATAPPLPPSRSSHCFPSDRVTGFRPPRNFSSPRPSRRRCPRFLGGAIHQSSFHRMCAVPEHSDSVPDPPESSGEQSYHPSEELGEPALMGDCEDVRLTDAETARTIIEVNSKAAVMFSGLIDDEVHENIIWPDLPYLTDEHGDIYFAVKEDEDFMQTLITDDKLVQVIIGLDNIEMLMEMGVPGPSNFDFGVEDISSDDSDTDDDYDEDVVVILEDEEDDMVSSETSSEWANLETLNSSHPMYFARKIAEVYGCSKYILGKDDIRKLSSGEKKQ